MWRFSGLYGGKSGKVVNRLVNKIENYLGSSKCVNLLEWIR